jgi:hypothetical protein
MIRIIFYIFILTIGPKTGLAAETPTLRMHDKLGQIIGLKIPETFVVRRLGHGSLPVGDTAARLEVTLPPDQAAKIGFAPQAKLLKLRFAPPGAVDNMIAALATQYRQPIPALLSGLNGYSTVSQDSVLWIEATPIDKHEPALWLCPSALLSTICQITIVHPQNLEIRFSGPINQNWAAQNQALITLVDGWLQKGGG